MFENLRNRFRFLLSPNGVKYMLRDFFAVFRFLKSKEFNLSLINRLKLVKQLYIITFNLDCPHTQEEIIAYIIKILATPPSIKGCFVEAGCYKGGSTAKFSLAAQIIKRKLVVFDSFEGIPKNIEEREQGLFGGSATFREGDYRGSFEEVKFNIAKYGSPSSCEFVKGWFDNTMVNFKEPIAGIYLDVDLKSSTRTCLKNLYPLLQPEGYLLSQDGHLPRIVKLFNNDKFWEKEVGCKKPHFASLGKKKLIMIQKKL